MAFFTISLAPALREGATRQRMHAKRAHKMLRMPFFVERIDRPARHCLATARAHAACLLVVVRVAIGFSSVLVKRPAPERFFACGAHEMLRVPLLAERVDGFAFYGLVAAGATRAERAVETTLAVRPTVTLEKAASLEGT